MDVAKVRIDTPNNGKKSVDVGTAISLLKVESVIKPAQKDITKLNIKTSDGGKK